MLLGKVWLIKAQNFEFIFLVVSTLQNFKDVYTAYCITQLRLLRVLELFTIQ